MSEYNVSELLISMISLKLAKRSSKNIKQHLFKKHRDAYRQLKEKELI